MDVKYLFRYNKTMNFNKNKIELTFRKLSEKEFEEILNLHYVENFKEVERKSFERIRRLRASGNYLCYGFFEQQKLVAFLFGYQKAKYFLVDYFAVCGKNKGHGYGTCAFKIIKERFSESPSQNLEDEILVKRLNFYKKLDMKKIGLNATLSGECYEILASEKIDAHLAKDVLFEMYEEMLVGKIRKVKIKFDFVS